MTLSRIVTAGFMLCLFFLSSRKLEANPLTATVWADEEFEVYISTSEIVDGSLFLDGNGDSEDPQTAEAQLVAGVTNYLHVKVKDEQGDGCVWIGTFSVGDSNIFSDITRTLSTGSVFWRMSHGGLGQPYEYIENLGTNGTAPWGMKDDISATAEFIGGDNSSGDYYFSLPISPTNIDTPSSRYQYIIWPEPDFQTGKLELVRGLPLVGLLDNGDDRAMSVPDPGRVGVRLKDSVNGTTADDYTRVLSEMELSDFVVTPAADESSAEVSVNLRLKGNLTAGAGDPQSTTETATASTTLMLLAQVKQGGNLLFTTSEVTYEAIHSIGGENPETRVTSEGEFGLGILGFLQPVLPADPGGDAGDFAAEFNLDIDELITLPSFTVDTGVPFSVRLYFEAATTAASDGGRAMADIQFTGGLSFPYEGPVFNVPEGFTVDALSASVVDNRFEPAGVTGPSDDKVFVDGIFMEIPEVPGGSTSVGREDWIELLSVASGLENPSKPFSYSPLDFAPVTVSKRPDIASPILMHAVGSGENLGDVFIVSGKFGSGNTRECFQYQLADTTVVDYDIHGQAGEFDQETVSFGYSQINWVYQKIFGSGGLELEVSAFWNLENQSGGLSSRSPENDAPTVGPVGSQTVEVASAYTVDITIGDTETDENNLEVTVTTSNPNLIGDLEITGTGANRQLTYRTSALRSGFASISITVSDGIHSRTTSIPVLIDVEMTPFEAYLAAYFGEEQIDNLNLVSPILDPDKDNIPTVVEYLLGTNPMQYNRTSEAIGIDFNRDSENCTCTLDFSKRLDDPNVQGYFWVSNNLKDWERMDPENPLYEETVTTGQTTSFGQARATITFPDVCEEPKFVRFQVTDVF